MIWSSRLSSVVFLSVPHQMSKLSEIGAIFRYHRRKSGSPSKNMTSDFAPEVANTPKVAILGACRPIVSLR